MTRVLVIGGTGKIGRHLVTASLNYGHPTAVLVRPATVAADPAKAASLRQVQGQRGKPYLGVVAAIKQAGGVVMSAASYTL